jgi:4-hydroxy-L-threonine phosphate dehydrogenase PdxA
VLHKTIIPLSEDFGTAFDFAGKGGHQVDEEALVF